MIKEFQGQYRWLSNFAPCFISIDGRTYKSVEHAYMSEKSNDIKWKEYCQIENSPGNVKKVSKTICLVENWDLIKVDIMRYCINQKYNKEPYRTLLIETGNEFIQEGNYWGDEFWGVNLKNGIGVNMLGILIMAKRKELIK